MESKKEHNPERYRRLSEPFKDSNEASAAWNAFIEDVQQAREKPCLTACGTTSIEWPTQVGQNQNNEPVIATIKYTESHFGEKKEIGDFTATAGNVAVTLSGFSRSAQPEIFNLFLQAYEAGKRANPAP